MIQGLQQAFKFTTPYNFDDITTIVAVFDQANNIRAGMPITKRYNNSMERLSTEWSETDKDTSKVYRVGTKYYRYDSGSWVSSDTPPSENAQVVDIDDLNDRDDTSKIYKCCPLYYIYEGGEWTAYANPAEVAQRNDGFGPVNGDPKSFCVVLTDAETSLFVEKYKGRVQIQAYSDVDDTKIKSKIEYFTVYPSITGEIFPLLPSTTADLFVFDAGTII